MSDWAEQQRLWLARFKAEGSNGIRFLVSVYWCKQWKPGDEAALASDALDDVSVSTVAPSKAAWMVQNGFAVPIQMTEGLA